MNQTEGIYNTMIKYLEKFVKVLISILLGILQLGLIVLFFLFLSGSPNEEAVNLFILFNCDLNTFLKTIDIVLYSILIIIGLSTLRLGWLLLKEKK